MEKTDTRPPFAASGGVIPPEFRKIKTPCYVLDETALIKNAELMGKIAEKTGCKMLLAQKAFSNYDCYHFLEPFIEHHGLLRGLVEACIRNRDPEAYQRTQQGL